VVPERTRETSKNHITGGVVIPLIERRSQRLHQYPHTREVRCVAEQLKGGSHRCRHDTAIVKHPNCIELTERDEALASPEPVETEHDGFGGRFDARAHWPELSSPLPRHESHTARRGDGERLRTLEALAEEKSDECHRHDDEQLHRGR